MTLLEQLLTNVQLSQELKQVRVWLHFWRLVSMGLCVILLCIVLSACKQAGMHWLDTVPKQSCQKDGSC